MLKMKKTGFTLIELLVVIAIIGLLVSINIIAIIRYRDKTKDAKIEAVLSQIRPVATMIYNDKNSFESVCNDGDSGEGNDNTLNDNVEILKTAEDELLKFTSVKCYDIQGEYCVQSPLILGGSYCINSTGYAGRENRNCASGHERCAP